MHYVKCLLLFGLFLLLPPAIMADSMRCGNKLVVTGDSKMEVLKKCGEPDFAETVKLLTKSKQVTVNEARQNHSNLNHSNLNRHNASSQGQTDITLSTETTEIVEQWTYNRGSTQFIEVLTFRGGRLESVEERQRGYTKTD